jgi:hypothetical protein
VKKGNTNFSDKPKGVPRERRLNLSLHVNEKESPPKSKVFQKNGKIKTLKKLLLPLTTNFHTLFV